MDKKRRNMGRRRKNQSKNRENSDENLNTKVTTTSSKRTRKLKKITNERLTIPAGIFNNGVKSNTARGKSAGDLSKRQHRAVLEEDLHALLHEANSESSEDNHPLSCVNSLQSNHTLKKNRGGHKKIHNNLVSCKSPKNIEEATCNWKRKVSNGKENRFVNLTRESQRSKKNSEISKIQVCEQSHSEAVFYEQNAFFCGELVKQLNCKPKNRIFLQIKLEITAINSQLDGNFVENPSAMSSSKKRSIPEEDFSKCVDPLLLVPPSQWVYNTPDKQNMKKFVFEDGNTKYLPAVIHTSKKTKVLYDIKNEYAGHVNLNRFKKGEAVPIDRRFLKTICENYVGSESESEHQAKKKRRNDSKENVFNFDEFVSAEPERCFNFNKPSNEEFNLFQNNSEESIDIHNEIQKEQGNFENCNKFDFGNCMSALPIPGFENKETAVEERSTFVPVDYTQQLLMATQRPSKTVKKVQKRHLLKAKSLSFENTPPGAKLTCIEPKKIQIAMNEDECLDQFEREFGVINTGVFPNCFGVGNAPHTITSGALEAQNVEESVPEKVDAFSLVPEFKFFPRRNYDPE